ncbi:hypothetical protein [uncultured Ruegeria sp.]|uniref:hypothetical protein n=1 Tax=uncultured Ruegeria sp. TaxID=259304 RepID=UPI002616AA3C|nr:hypothetical protein [uncultured Ruegeria sp.]
MRASRLQYPALAAFLVSACLGSSLRAESEGSGNEMFQLRPTLAALLAFGDTTSALTENEVSKRIDYKRGEMFQNIAAEQARPLLANTPRVTTWWDGQYMEKDGYAAVAWHGADGKEHAYITDSSTRETNGQGIRAYSGYVFDFKMRYPLKRFVDTRGDTAYQLLRYGGQTGELTTYLAGKRRWWENGIDHLQAHLPASVWDILPSSPSAESSDVQVNTKQTFRFYGKLLQHDPSEGN